MSGFSAAARFRRVQRQLLQVPSRVSRDASVELEKMWRRSYLAGTDPYGNAWAANAASTIRKKGHDLVMFGKDEPNETFQSTRVRPLPGAGLALSTGVKASWHLEPSGNRPARPVLPLHGLPAAWKAALERVYQRAAREAVGRG